MDINSVFIKFLSQFVVQHFQYHHSHNIEIHELFGSSYNFNTHVHCILLPHKDYSLSKSTHCISCIIIYQSSYPVSYRILLLTTF